PIINALFHSRHTARKRRAKRKEKDVSYEKRKGAMTKNPKGVLVNFWTTAHPKLGRKFPRELLMGRSRLNLYHLCEYSP
ncbi:unnamed protein product, partial [Hymenolepis diminuta]